MLNNVILTSFAALFLWVGAAPVVGFLLRRYLSWGESSGIFVLAVGFCVGMASNFLAFFLCGLFGNANHIVLLLIEVVLIFFFWGILWGLMRRGGDHGHKNEFSFVVPLILFLWVAWQFYSGTEKRIPGVFDSWDAVVSWNRWAMEWYFGGMPTYTMGYPQILPTALAQLYILFGDVMIQPVVRLFLLMFALFPLLLFFDGSFRWRSSRFLWGGLFWLASLTWLFPDMVDSGYADIPGACFVAISGYFLLLGVAGAITTPSSLYLAAFSAAAAVLTKQPAGLAWLVWLAVACRTWVVRPSMRNVILRAACLFCIISAPWYLYVAFQIFSENEVSNILYLVQGIHGDRGWIERLHHASSGPFMEILSSTGHPWKIVFAMTILFAFACLDVLGRWLLGGIVVPFFLLWALLFSYDVRNLLPMLGVVCLLLGIGTAELINCLLQALKLKTSIASKWNGVNFGMSSTILVWIPLFGFLGFVGFVFGNDLRIDSVGRLQGELQYQMGSQVLNEKLLEYGQTPGFDGLVVTTYLPMIVIEQLNQYTPTLTGNPNLGAKTMKALIAGRRLCEALDVNSARMKGINYLLLHRNIFPQVMDRALVDGSLRLELEVDAIRLMRINCRRD